MTHTFRGKRYRIILNEYLGRDYGLCDNPNRKEKSIKLNRNLDEKQLLAFAIHEALHACLWDLDEQAIDSSSADIARFLYRLGFRKECNG